MATNIGEGKLNTNLLNCLKIDLEGLVNTHTHTLDKKQ